jgi:putative hydrolase of the HAD superfamily
MTLSEVNQAAVNAAVDRAAIDWAAVDTVMLDMDGTVLDLAFDNHFWRVVVPQRYAQQHGLDPQRAWAELEPHFRKLQGRLEWYCLDHWSGVTRLDLAAIKREVRHDIRPLAGSLAFLDAVRASGRPLWLVTNAHVNSWMVKLEHTGLRHRFDEVICSHDFGAPKESADFWTRFSARHPFDPRRVLFVDDSLPVLRAARHFGLPQTVAVRRPDSTQQAQRVEEFPAVDALAELLPIA